MRRLIRRIRRLGRAQPAPPPFREPVTIDEIRRRSLGFLEELRVARRGRLLGYRHAASTRRPILYAAVAALLLKHLYGVREETDEETLDLLVRAQGDDGLFRDPVVACRTAEEEDWWGWRHLTLHALMTLALWRRPAAREIRYLDRFRDPDRFRAYLRSRDWGARAAWTSNEVQNIGVMLQYARDEQGDDSAPRLLDLLYEEIESRQDPSTGLFGARFESPEEISLGVQSAYHFILLYAYDRRRPPRSDRMVEGALRTQNALGGYGLVWPSTACEDIDSVDVLVRYGADREDVQASLRRALPAILGNLNSDGGWVFRRREATRFVHREMSAGVDEGNAFSTWFRTLALAYCLRGLRNPPAALRYDWRFDRAPGHQLP